MINVAKSFDAGIIIMHIKGNPKTMQNSPFYLDVVDEIKEFLITQSTKAKQNGIDKIIIDPGIGFGKSVDDNFKLIKQLNDFSDIGFPVMIGLSKNLLLVKLWI